MTLYRERNASVPIKFFESEGSGLTDETAEFVANIVNLNEVQIGKTSITNEGLKKLFRSPTLCSIDVRNSQVTFEGLQQPKHSMAITVTVAYGQFTQVQIQTLSQAMEVIELE